METALVARDEQLLLARHALATGRGAVIIGEPGVGKTVLAAATVRDLPGFAGGHAWLVATRAGRRTPFGVLAPLLPADLTGVHPAAVPQIVLRALQPAGQRPVVAVDDAQLLDEHSAAALLALVAAGQVRLLATVQTGAKVSDAVRALWKDQLLTRIELGPLDRAGAHALLVAQLGGEVATTDSERLWQAGQGNPLYLTELVRFGRQTGQLRQDAGIWWWQGEAFGEADVPPLLNDLLAHRLDDLTQAGRDTLDVLALGEPLPYDTLAHVTSAEAVVELDERGLIASADRDGVVWLRFAHPLVRAAAERRLTAARRRWLAGRLRRAPAANVPLVSRAIWEEAAGSDPNPELLLAAAEAVLVTDPRTAVRFAARIARSYPGPAAALLLSNANAELGRLAAARDAVGIAAGRVRDEHDRLLVGFEDISLSVWSQREPARAAATLDVLRAELPDRFADELDTAGALLAMFNARPADALRAADRVLGRTQRGPLDASVLVRALTVRLAALTVADRPDEALTCSARLQAVLPGASITAPRRSLAHAVIALAHHQLGQPVDVPRAYGAFGQWPADPIAGGGDGDGDGDGENVGPAWPLLEGMRLLLAGDWAKAVVALREAFVRQSAGEGLFYSEATGGLIVALAGSGEVEEAADLLRTHPPDDIALIPGLRDWAAASVDGARGSTTAAAKLALRAAQESIDVGAPALAYCYLAEAARHGAAGAAAEAAQAVAPARSPIAKARSAYIRARADGRTGPMVEAAEQNLAGGLWRSAVELAQLAVARAGSGSSEGELAARARSVIRRGGAALGVAEPPGAETRLTARELEVARLASAGLSDRDIAGELFVSVRTVESHLASAYRKLDIKSRHALTGALVRTK